MTTKSLRSSGVSHRLPDRAQVLEAAAEAALLGQHRDRVGAARGVGRGERGRVGDVGEVALARASAA